MTLSLKCGIRLGLTAGAILCRPFGAGNFIAVTIFSDHQQDPTASPQDDTEEVIRRWYYMGFMVETWSITATLVR